MRQNRSGEARSRPCGNSGRSPPALRSTVICTPIHHDRHPGAGIVSGPRICEPTRKGLPESNAPATLIGHLLQRRTPVWRSCPTAARPQLGACRDTVVASPHAVRVSVIPAGSECRSYLRPCGGGTPHPRSAPANPRHDWARGPASVRRRFVHVARGLPRKDPMSPTPGRRRCPHTALAAEPERRPIC
jgi:hypothetical protein